MRRAAREVRNPSPAKTTQAAADVNTAATAKMTHAAADVNTAAAPMNELRLPGLWREEK
jgi:hypothetical protein